MTSNTFLQITETEKQKQMKKRSIVKKSIIRLIILAAVILVGTSLVAGIVFYQKMVRDNVELAYSFAGIATLEVSGDVIDEMIDNADRLPEIYKMFLNYSPEKDEKLAISPSEKDMLDKWSGMEAFLFQAVHSNSNLRTFQIVYPEDEEVVCIWLEQRSSLQNPVPMTRRPLRPGELEDMKSAEQLNKGYKADIEVNRVDGEVVGTAIYPVWNSEGETVAYAELDLSLTGVRKAILLQTLAIAGIIVIILAAALFGYYIFLQREVLRPVLQLEKATEDVVDKLKNDAPAFELNIHTGDELEALSHSFENMEENLREYIKENAAITSEREKVVAELDLAARIQDDMLPSVFPAFPDRKEFDIYASMTPAREVGGDFYDFFMIDDNTLALVIADVSGKGIPASLFMMRSMLMIENLAAGTRSPAEILGSLNDQICKNNESGMFVTIWLGILDIRTGVLTAANAGHEYPILQMPGERFEVYKDRHGFVAGGAEGVSYKDYELKLSKGSAIFLYTDGVPEAQDADNNMFGIPAAVDALNKSPEASPEELLRLVDQSVLDFVKDAEQFDDLTMLCLRYNGCQEESSAQPEEERSVNEG